PDASEPGVRAAGSATGPEPGCDHGEPEMGGYPAMNRRGYMKSGAIAGASLATGVVAGTAAPELARAAGLPAGDGAGLRAADPGTNAGTADLEAAPTRASGTNFIPRYAPHFG